MDPSLSVLQWNCRALTSKIPHLLYYLQIHSSIHVLMLQSLNISPKALPQLDGFYYPPVYSAEKERVMVATYVSTKLHYTKTNPPVVSGSSGCRISCCSVRIATRDRKPIELVNVYYPEGSCQEQHVEWLNQINHDEVSWVIGGDFNVSHKSWDTSTPPGKYGEHLSDVILNSHLVLLNHVGWCTRIGTGKQRNSAIDLTLVSAGISGVCDWQVGFDSLQSDHLPVHIAINQDVIDADVDNTPKYQYDKANWSLFKTTLELSLKDFKNTSDEPNVMLQEFRERVLIAADKAIPKRKVGAGGIHRHTSVWWNEACSKATAVKRKALRNWKKNMCEANRVELEQATKCCHDVAEQAKKEHFEKFCSEEIQGPQDAGKIWRKLRKMKRRYRQPEQPLVVDGKTTSSAREKADALASTFAAVNQTAHLSLEEQTRRKEEERKFLHPLPDNEAVYNADLTITELKEAVANLTSASKAPGRDPISYQMIKHFPDTALTLLLKLFQRCWELGIVPECWKDALVIGLPKDGKPRHLSSSYRPISLTPHLGKLYERIVTNRLSHCLEKWNVIPRCQAGFRKGRNCMEQVVHLVEQVKHAMQRKQTLVATFFDISKAFDTVWHGKLLDKLARIGISGRLYEFVMSFLTQRQLAVKVAGAVSQSYVLDMGVPQGSVIAPLLFSVMLYDIEAKMRKGFHMTLYADDLAIWSTCPKVLKQHRKYMGTEYQDQIDEIQDYMTDNGFALSVEKTVFMVFTRRRVDKSSYTIYIGDTEIQQSQQVKFLGVTLTSSLCWSAHLSNLKAKASRSVNLIKILSVEEWCTPKALSQLTYALVRSKLLYGHEVYFPASDTAWNSLQSVELKALKASLNLCSGAANMLIYQEVGWLPLREQSLLQRASFQVRVHTVPNCVQADVAHGGSDNFRQMRLQRKPSVLLKTCPLAQSTAAVWDAAGVNPSEARPDPPPNFPPWLRERPEVICHLGDAKKSENPIYLSLLAKEKLSKFTNFLQVYTDASITESGEVGCAFIIPALNIAKQFQLNSGISIFTAELYAILMACTFLTDLPVTPNGIVILSDSKSVLQALNRGGTKNRADMQADVLLLIHQLICRGSIVKLMWVPSHVGIEGNEKVDKAARQAVQSGQRTYVGFSLSEIKTKLRKTVYEQWDIKRKATCEKRNWTFLAGTRCHTPPFPRRNIKIITRLRTRCPAFRFFNRLCPCGCNISLDHMLSDCAGLPAALIPVNNLRKQWSLRPEQFLFPHPELGISHMRLLSDCIAPLEWV